MSKEGETQPSTQPVTVQTIQPVPKPQTPQPAQAIMSYGAASWAPQPRQTPATQYAHYQNYYPQAQYYPSYVPPAGAPPPATQTPAAQAARPAQQQQPQQQQQASTSGSTSTADITTLNDALGSAGVDLRAEEESLQRSYEQHQVYRSYEDRTRKQPPMPSFNTQFLTQTMRIFATPHKVSKIPDDSTNYLALALRTRLQELITGMIAAAHHRNDTQFDRPASLYEDGTPMWSLIVRSDVAKQLAVLERVEREEELRIRRERKERADMAAAQAAQLAAQASGGAHAMAIDSADDESGGQKKKKKKDGPGVTARNMSEDVRKKMSNAVASQAAGLGGKYAWMTAASSSTSSTKAKPAPVTSSPNPSGTASTPATTTAPATGSTGTGSASSSWARPYVPTKKTTTQAAEEDNRMSVTLRDALFVIEKERGHGGGRGAARVYI